MAGDGTADDALFRLWQDGARAFASLAAGMAPGEDSSAARPAAGTAAGAWAQAGHVYDAWSRFLDALAAAHAERAAGPGASPFDPAGWLRGEGDGGMADLWRWLEGPGFADMLSEERRLLREGGEWIRFMAALEQFRAIVAEGWLRAFRSFAERLAADEDAPEAATVADDAAGGAAGNTAGDDAPGQGAGAAAWDRLMAHWRAAADAEVARLQSSEAYLSAQRDLLDTGLALRASLRARAEGLAEFLGLPTRAELDDVHESLHALRREIRSLRRDMARPDTARPDTARPDAAGGAG
ncbi:MAG: poly(R)-hydroxyalkanoic acid synthase subunit PhaE [Pseudomonadota bacterium]